MSLIIGRTLSNPLGMWNDTTTPQNIAIQQRRTLADVELFRIILLLRFDFFDSGSH